VKGNAQKPCTFQILSLLLGKAKIELPPWLEIDIEKENKAIAKEYKELLRISYQTLSPDDKKLIRKAFDVAVDAHQ
jgi:hypothetical protein